MVISDYITPVMFLDPSGHIKLSTILLGLAVVLAVAAVVVLAPYIAAGLATTAGITLGGITLDVAVTAGGLAVLSGLSLFASQTVVDRDILTTADMTLRNNINGDDKNKYWSASLTDGVVSLGEPLTYDAALALVARGGNVFSRTYADAEKLASAAGTQAKPILHQLIKPFTPGFYSHFHTYDYPSNKSHIWYLF